MQACLQENLLSFDFLQKNERITNIFARIAKAAL